MCASRLNFKRPSGGRKKICGLGCPFPLPLPSVIARLYCHLLCVTKDGREGAPPPSFLCSVGH